MTTCPSCGNETPEGSRFCNGCGTPLTELGAVQEERKVVSVLFCDLVGFTSASEGADPEDVRARLRPYHERLRRELEMYGGTVEKFVGDAVMAVFGAPVAHEDDAERAVRAGLRILEAIEELNDADPVLGLQVRVGINTGEAVVALQARPELGEGFVTGDVVNTASRLQGVAPVDAVAVSEETFRATERVFEWEPLEPVAVKGKPDPLAIFRPLRPRARFGSDVTRAHTAPFVGRDLEKPLLLGVFERAAKQSSCQLVTIVGEPGVGKSRLCMELFAYLEERPGLVRWRQGRCLPYGDGIAVWALGEIMKAEAGILESDPPEVARAKLEQALPAEDPDLAWLRARVQPLIGVGGEPASQDESFTAWRRVLEAWAAEHETVLVFEDLHWADDALLSFLEHLADWAEGVPLLVVCTARPELYERHPGWAGGLRNATTVNLPPLTDEETAQLVAALLERAVVPAETKQRLLERAGGNPLYAEEFVRLLADRDRLDERGDVPESVQALIAARLDTLTAERKSLLQDASVIGKVFWAGALSELGGRDVRDVEHALHELGRKELVRPARGSSMAGEAEYGFWHLLVRDVCYQQIPRAARADKHQAVAAWLERKAGDRAEDLADVLAYHYLEALELMRASGTSGPTTKELEAAAVRCLALAGERAFPLDAERAEDTLARALELTPPGHPQRISILDRWARAAESLGRHSEAIEALEEVLAVYRERGDSLAAGRVLTALVHPLWGLGDPRRKAVIAQAIELLEGLPAGQELVDAYTQLAGVHVISGRYPDSISAADRSAELASSLGLPEPARALEFGGLARSFLGDGRGLDQMRRGLTLLIERSESRDAGAAYGNLAFATGLHEGPEAAAGVAREGVKFCDRRGVRSTALFNTVEDLRLRAASGHVDDLLDQAESLIESVERSGSVTAAITLRSVHMRVLAARGTASASGDDAEVLAARARATGIPEVIAVGIAGAAAALTAAGELDRARALLFELEQFQEADATPDYVDLLPGMVRLAIAAGETAVAQRFVEGVQPLTPLAGNALTSANAQLAEALGDYARAAPLYADAAERWRGFGDRPEQAYALLGHGRSLLALEQGGVEVPLTEARDLFASMGYAPAVDETEKLLAEASAAAA
ncbi:MAG: hypothetical protein C5B48_14675 [Candidatus Rokuibacteriota bacterium]|nr:MAG: hypothetical protein C5B48_14675 [Candidatus Rokubacteria bacterium]